MVKWFKASASDESACPLLGRLPQGQKQQLQRRLLVGESAARLDDFAQRPVQRFHAVGGVDGASDVRRYWKNGVIRAQFRRHTWLTLG